jgi:hypothetical protein
MLTQTKPIAVIVNLPAQPVAVGYETVIELVHKKTAQHCTLFVHSFELLSLQDARQAINKGLGSHWDWHQLSSRCDAYAF